MIKRLLPLALLSSLVLSINAFAATTLSSVSVTLLPESIAFQPGDLIGGTKPRTTTGHTEVSSYNVSTNSFSAKSPYTVDLTLSPKDGYTFTSPISVSVKGCTHVEITALSDSAVSLRCKTYPIYRLLNPGNFEDNGGYAEWSKVKQAQKYNVQIYYLDEDGRQKTASKSTIETFYDYGEYLDKFDDARISVQAVPTTNNNETKFMCSSDYIFADNGSVDTAKSPKSFTSFPSVSINKGKKGTTNTTKTNSSNKKSSGKSNTQYGYTGNIGPGGPGNAADGWAGNGTSWVYLKNGTPIKSQWLAEEDGNWYYMGNNGYMLLGWQYINDKWYYLNTSPNRKIGSVLTGWQLINDKWYYLEPNHNGNFGQLYTDTITPDGYKVGPDGAMQ